MEAKVFSVIHELLTSVSQTVGSPAQEPSELVKTLLEERASIRKQLEEVGVQVRVLIKLSRSLNARPCMFLGCRGG